MMAHTIEEMQEAKRKLCYEIGNKLAAFENEYNVEMCEIEYQPRSRIYRELGDEVIQISGYFEMEVKL